MAWSEIELTKSQKKKLFFVQMTLMPLFSTRTASFLQIRTNEHERVPARTNCACLEIFNKKYEIHLWQKYGSAILSALEDNKIKYKDIHKGRMTIKIYL